MSQERKKILYIITKSVWGGGATYVYDLANNMDPDDFSVSVAAGGQDVLAQKIEEKDIPYFKIKNFQRTINPLKDIFAIFEIISLIKKIKPDIIHVNSSKAGGVVGLSSWLYKRFTGHQPRLIFTAHGWAFAEDRSRWQKGLIKIFSKITCLFYDKIICVSQYDFKLAIKNNITEGSKLVMIHNGIDPDSISFLSREQAQQKLIGRPSPLVIGTIAEWTKNKGLEYLLEALSKINQSNPDKKLDVVLIGSGENPDEEKMRRLIKQYQLENVHLVPYIDKAVNYLKGFDIFVLPSLKEGLPYSILEAMAAKLPIIATNVGGIPEALFSETALTSVSSAFESSPGILLQPKNSQQLAKKIIYLLNSQETARQFAKQAKDKLIREFTLERMVNKTKKIY